MESVIDVERKLRGLPPPTFQEFQRTRNLLEKFLTGEEVDIWATDGFKIATETARSWEAAVEYFVASQEVARVLSYPAFNQWSRSGLDLTRVSPSIAVDYFKASPNVIPNIRPQHITRWASLGRSLFTGTWKSSSLASKFFQVSPGLSRNLLFWDVEVFCGLIEDLSCKSHDIANECLTLGENVLTQMHKDREAFLSLLRTMVPDRWQQVNVCLELGIKSLSLIETDQRIRFIRIAEQLCQDGYSEIDTFFRKASQSMGYIGYAKHAHVIDLCDILVNLNAQLVPAFMFTLDQVVELIGENHLDAWFERGIRVVKENPDGGLAYFNLESNTAVQTVDILASGIELGKVKDILRLYCRALSGYPIEILKSQDLVDKGIGWVGESQASTEGTKVFLPSKIDNYSKQSKNFACFKVVATHQVSHLEFGSFDFQFDRPSILFENKRNEWERGTIPRTRMNNHLPGKETVPHTDMERFFDLFKDRRLCMDIFTALEDGRLDHRVLCEYKGINFDYRWVQQDALERRQEIENRPLREAMVEMIIRLSLGQTSGIELPKGYKQEVQVLAKIVKRLFNPVAIVEDTSEATIRVYDILSRLSNHEELVEDWEHHDFNDAGVYSEEELETLLSQMSAPVDSATNENMEEGEERTDRDPYNSPEQVDYRGEFKPELVQLLNQLRSEQKENGEKETQSISLDMLKESLKKSSEFETDNSQGEETEPVSTFIENIMKEVGAPPPDASGESHAPIGHSEESGGQLEARDPGTFVYDEWDFRAADYKPNWCIVREKTVENGEVSFFNDVLRNYSALMTDIRRQFELVIPESFRKINRLNDGEDIDLNAAIEASVDKQSGITPSEKVYWSRNKVERDVAVVFLLDMSASTAEAIDDGRYNLDTQSVPDDPVEYMLWLRTRREGLGRRQYKRIIDLEKESTVLLIQALELIGDTYGIYGFSGYGRENVEFYVIKDIDQGFEEANKRRLDKVTPLHATRMGPAIRHAISKLERQDNKTKILFLISDGRPQDRGYSREGVEKEYAVHDTHKALLEAKHKKIVPFCLTVDRTGHDYLKTMCGDMGYEVLGDIWSLPSRLPMLYRRLTV